MIIPLREHEPEIDFFAFMSLLGEQHGWDFQDMSGLFKEGSSGTEPYENVWHWLIDGPFMDANNGSSTELYSELIEDEHLAADLPQFVRVVLTAIFDAVPADHPARNGDCINFYIHW